MESSFELVLYTGLCLFFVARRVRIMVERDERMDVICKQIALVSMP